MPVSLRANQARIKLGEPPTGITIETAEAGAKRVRVKQQKERPKNVMEILRREKMVRTAFLEPGQTEQRKRLMIPAPLGTLADSLVNSCFR